MVGLSFAALAALVISAAAATEMTMCDLSHRADIGNRVISAKARIGFTSHGIVLLSDGCPKGSEDVVLLFPGHERTPHVAFELDPRAMQSLRPFFRPTGGTAIACAVVTGELHVKRDFRASRAGASPVGNGFGPRGAFRRAFILRDVADVRSCQ